MEIKDFLWLSKDGTKHHHTLVWGRSKGKRYPLDMFTYVKPANKLEKDHNKETLEVIKHKISEMTLDFNAKGTGYISDRKSKANIIEFYQEWVTANQPSGQHNHQNSLAAFKKFLKKDAILACDIDEDLCKNFRKYLLAKYKGGTPKVYFCYFKTVIEEASKKGFFRNNPCLGLESQGYDSQLKDILELDEIESLLKTSIQRIDIKKAIIFTLYTGLRFCQVKTLKWEQVQGFWVNIPPRKKGAITTIPLHPMASTQLGERGKDDDLVFTIPDNANCNIILNKWVVCAGINKKLTWHGLRHTTSVILQDAKVEIATVAGILGHKSTKHVHETYKRYRVKAAEKAINLLPSFEEKKAV